MGARTLGQGGICLALLICLLGGAAAVAAGPLHTVGVKGGFHVGGQNYVFDGAELFEPDNTWNVAFGAFAEWKRSRRATMHLVTELLWVRKGIDSDKPLRLGIEGEPEDVGATGEQSLTMLSIPIMAKLTAGPGESHFYFLAGPSVEILLDSDANAVFDELRSVNLGAHIGLGFDRGSESGIGLLIEARYVQDLLNGYSEPDGPEPSLESVRNRGLLVLVGLRR